MGGAEGDPGGDAGGEGGCEAREGGCEAREGGCEARGRRIRFECGDSDDDAPQHARLL